MTVYYHDKINYIIKFTTAKSIFSKMFWNFLKDNDIHQLKTFNLNFANFSKMGKKTETLVNYLPRYKKY